MKNSKFNFFTYFTWSLALLSILLLTVDLFIRVPEPLNPFLLNSNFEGNNQFIKSKEIPDNQENVNENCCIATIFDKNSIKQTISLGHSLFNSYKGTRSKSIPRTFALFKTHNSSRYISKKELSVLKKYFQIINITNKQLEQTNDMEELLFWQTPELKSCFPVVGVTHNGLFNKAPTKIVNSKPFSAVSKTGDIVFFDTSLMVLDPTQTLVELDEKYKKNAKNRQFKRYINYQITDWKPLSTDLSVEDYQNDFLDFWLKYGTPTFIHFDDDTFFGALKNNNATSGSPGLFKIIKEILDEVKSAHPNIF